MKSGRFILGWAFITFLLCISMLLSPLIATIKHLFTSSVPAPGMYSDNEMIFGILAEIVRAFILCCLYPKFNSNTASYASAIKFGLLTSGLIWTFWALYRVGTFNFENPIAFFIEESIIFIVQGIFSGIGLHFVYKKMPERNNSTFL